MDDNEQSFDVRVRESLDFFRNRLSVIRALALTQLKHAAQNWTQERNELTTRIESLGATFEQEDMQPHTITRAIVELYNAKETLDALNAFDPEEVLAETIFTAAFSSFDAYMGRLLRILFGEKPEILCSNEDPTIHFGEVIKFTKEEIVERTVDQTIDSLLRNSYAKSFETLAKRFKVGSLTDYPGWPKFVECSQRRNVITHCGGVATRQYIECCKKSEVLGDGIAEGKKLTVDSDYLSNAIEVVEETGLKLGQVLWRSVSSDSIDKADSHLGHLMFQLLKAENWQLARKMGEFGAVCAKRNYERPRKEQVLKIIVVNHAQAAKWSGDADGAQRIMGTVDWSGSGLEFRLAEACIRENWEDAANLMRQIGKDSKDMPIHAYESWPIFRQFRDTEQFRAMFDEVFGVSFEGYIRSDPESESDDGSGEADGDTQNGD